MTYTSNAFSLNTKQIHGHKIERRLNHALKRSFDNLISVEGALSDLYSTLNAKSFQAANKQIQTYLTKQKVTFEGKVVPVSLVPSIATEDEVASIEPFATTIRFALESVISEFISQHQSKNYDSVLHKAFAQYEPWFDLIANEQRILPHINLMRFDFVRECGNRWQILETNTCCPGGVITCGEIRRAWLNTEFASSFKERELVEYPLNERTGFVKFLCDRGRLVAGTGKNNIVICNHNNEFTNELDLMKMIFDHYKQDGLFDADNLWLADLRDIEFHNDQASLRGEPVSLIYNKIDQLKIKSDDQSIDGWLRSSRTNKTQYLNSFGSMILSEAKRILPILFDPYIADLLNFDKETLHILREVVPASRVLNWALSGDASDNQRKHDVIKFLKNNKNSLVLKADSLTRGEGVFVGKDCSVEQWNNAIETTYQNHGMVQRYAEIPSRKNFLMTDHDLVEHDEFFGFEMFLLGDSIGGIASRAHTNKVFNVGKGGKESPVIVLKHDGIDRRKKDC